MSGFQGVITNGRTQLERNQFDDELPVHTVTIAYDVCMGKFEVTQAQWLAVMGGWPDPDRNPDKFPYLGRGDDYPAYFISWNDCQAFVAALNTKGLGYMYIGGESTGTLTGTATLTWSTDVIHPIERNKLGATWL